MNSLVPATTRPAVTLLAALASLAACAAFGDAGRTAGTLPAPSPAECRAIAADRMRTGLQQQATGRPFPTPGQVAGVGGAGRTLPAESPPNIPTQGTEPARLGTRLTSQQGACPS